MAISENALYKNLTPTLSCHSSINGISLNRMGIMALDPNLPSESHPTSREPLKGIGGWLVLVAIGQVIGIIRTLSSLLQYYTNSQTHAAFIKIPLTMQGELGLNAAYAGLIIFSTYAFFAQKRYFRSLYVFEVFSAPLLFLLDALWISATTTLSFSATLDTDGVAKSIGACIPGAIWIIYMYRSTRVKNTFIN